MLSKKNSKLELSNTNYVPVLKDRDTFYGGSQMWFVSNQKYSKDNILHNYGCGTIATADFFLYLALQRRNLRTPETEIALRGGNRVYYENYSSYIHVINNEYTKTKPILAVLGTRIASVINDYSDLYDFGYKATWKFKLTYFDMLDMMEEMLSNDIPVILSIGPNTPKFWGKKGIPFYIVREIELPEESYESSQNKLDSTDKNNFPDDEELSNNCKDSYEDDSSFTTVRQSDDSEQEISENSTPVKKPYYYKVVVSDVNSHYVTVTGIIKDDITNRIMLRISSWGRQYYINYEEYWDYVDNIGGSLTSSIVYVTKN